MSVLVAAAPLFLLDLTLEAGWLRRRPTLQGLSNVSASLLQLVVGFALRQAAIAVTAPAHGLAPWSWPRGRVGAGLASLVVDLTGYLVHRATHRVQLLWSIHAPHHSCEAYDLSVALRVSALRLLDLPLAFGLTALGIPPDLLATVAGVHTLLQFPAHPEAIGRLGWLEAVLVTPSHHRVHHGRDPA